MTINPWTDEVEADTGCPSYWGRLRTRCSYALLFETILLDFPTRRARGSSLVIEKARGERSRYRAAGKGILSSSNRKQRGGRASFICNAERQPGEKLVPCFSTPRENSETLTETRRPVQRMKEEPRPCLTPNYATSEDSHVSYRAKHCYIYN